MNIDSLIWAFLAAIVSTTYFFLIKYYTKYKKKLYFRYSYIIRTICVIFIL